MGERGLSLDERRAWLLDHLGARGEASVTELSELFGVSAVTVRADLHALEDARLLRRVHGGALPVPDAPASTPAGPSPGRDAREAQAIGVAAAALVSSGDALLVDGGAVPTWLARSLVRRRDLRSLSICTSDLDVAQALRPAAGRFTVVLAGGTVRAGDGTLVAPHGTALDDFHADLGFLGCTGIDAVAGVTGADFDHAAVWRRCFAGSRRRVVLAPATAIGRRGRVTLAGVEDLDLLVTAESAGAPLDELRAAGLQVVAVA